MSIWDVQFSLIHGCYSHTCLAWVLWIWKLSAEGASERPLKLRAGIGRHVPSRWSSITHEMPLYRGRRFNSQRVGNFNWTTGDFSTSQLSGTKQFCPPFIRLNNVESQMFCERTPSKWWTSIACIWKKVFERREFVSLLSACFHPSRCNRSSF